MSLGENVWRVVKGSTMWLYCWLRIVFYWLAKVGGKSTIQFRRWLRRTGQKKHLVRLGLVVHELHVEGTSGWSDDNRVKEIIQALDDGDRKRNELQTRLQEKEDRYREKVKRLRQAQRSLPKESVKQSTADHGRIAAGSQ